MLQKTDLLLHPVRMRILLAVSMRSLTPLQLAEELVNVPQATLYRHLNKMVQAGILKVVEERPVRGTVEKVYGINTEAIQQEGRDLMQASREEWLEMFTRFTLGLVRDFATYLQRDKVNYIEDKFSFRQAPLYLTDAEFMEMAGEIGQAIMKRLPNKPSPERQAITWTTIIIPGPEDKTVQDEPEAETE